ncbi:sigma-70 family RNA polymerase sigma factor [Nakamurella lactea]|uniref:sigma-70 family RNA polymerase sigma factor n=1 Tax=Nakamurella lactea TaxID=459515 RepID=UPI00041DF2FF|nr:sigma-70 family RNA polymerase sigma factor [Nakamurella lactea]
MAAVQFEHFLAVELAPLGRFAAVLTGDRQLAHDVLTDALILASARWDRIGEMDHPTAYVRRIVVTTFLSDRRRAARRRTDPTDDESVLDGVSPDLSIRVGDRDQIHRLLEQLPPRQRAAVVLRYYLGLDDVQIGAELGASVGAVRTLVSRALAGLRESAVTAGMTAGEFG